MRGTFIEIAGGKGSTFLYKCFADEEAENKSMKGDGADFWGVEAAQLDKPKVSPNWGLWVSEIRAPYKDYAGLLSRQ